MVLEKLFSAVALPHALRPPYLRHVIEDLQRYLLQGVADEKKRLQQTDTSDERNTLMAALVRESEKDRTSNASGKAPDRLLPLTDTEIYGNMFIYYVAGHETTTSALNNAIILLAAFPDVQEWVREEVQQVLDTSDWDYKGMCSKLNRCLAVMVSQSCTGQYFRTGLN